MELGRRGRKRRLGVEDEYWDLHRAERVPIKVIARRLGCSKNTVKAALRRGSPPRYERARSGSIVDAVEPQIRELLAETPTMPATVIGSGSGGSCR